MDNRLKILTAAEKAGMVRFEGGELESYGSSKATADDHSKAFWYVANEQKLEAFLQFMKEFA